MPTISKILLAFGILFVLLLGLFVWRYSHLKPTIEPRKEKPFLNRIEEMPEYSVPESEGKG